MQNTFRFPEALSIAVLATAAMIGSPTASARGGSTNPDQIYVGLWQGVDEVDGKKLRANK